jgi:hypothetical protein
MTFAWLGVLSATPARVSRLVYDFAFPARHTIFESQLRNPHAFVLGALCLKARSITARHLACTRAEKAIVDVNHSGRRARCRRGGPLQKNERRLVICGICQSRHDRESAYDYGNTTVHMTSSSSSDERLALLVVRDDKAK